MQGLAAGHGIFRGCHTVKSSFQKRSRADAEGRSQFLHDGNRGIASCTFDVADIGAVNIGAISVLFLAPALFGPEAAKICGEALSDIHALQRDACRQSFYRR
jgi:hypothetical protein